ncbi:MAG: hypothetical protein AB8F34_12395 [Akkermansiaceae bacterium]
MIHWLGKCLCLLTALAVTDAHLMLVQGWAWSTMLQDRAPERGVVEAFGSTFNGAEPCPLCCAVQQEQNEEQEEAPIPESGSTAKWSPVLGENVVRLNPPHARHRGIEPKSHWQLVVRWDLPDLPPPQVLG